MTSFIFPTHVFMLQLLLVAVMMPEPAACEVLSTPAQAFVPHVGIRLSPGSRGLVVAGADRRTRHPVSAAASTRSLRARSKVSKYR